MNNFKDNRPPFRLIDKKTEIFSSIKTPCYVIDEEALLRNCEILKEVSEKTGAKVLLAQKAFSNYNFYNLLKDYLSGTEASGLYEARLGKEEMGDKEVHVFSGAYREDEFDEILEYADHIVFNSINQLKKFGNKAKKLNKSIGIRINPEISTQEGHEIYDPCANKSRLGVTRGTWDKEITDDLINMIDGIHFHTLCEQNSDDLYKTLKVVCDKFSDVLPCIKWINMGGGHHITRDDYDLQILYNCIYDIKKKYNIEVYLEPGEAVALNAGYLITRVLDIVTNGNDKIAILDSSAACHMPDVIEMPYLPPLYLAKEEGKEKYNYRLGGPTCLSGDIIGDYSFPVKLKENDMLIFGDMAIYTTCKNNTFNGMPLPSLYKRTKDDKIIKIKDFSYNDFKERLGK